MPTIPYVYLVVDKFRRVRFIHNIAKIELYRLPPQARLLVVVIDWTLLGFGRGCNDCKLAIAIKYRPNGYIS